MWVIRFISPGLNKIKAFSEFQLFAVLLVCTLMQANLAPAGFAGELIGMDGYGEILKILTMMILPVTLWFTFCAGDADAEKEPELVAKKEAKQAKKLEKKSSRKGSKQKQKDAKLKAKAAMKLGKKPVQSGARVDNPMEMGGKTSNPLFRADGDSDSDEEAEERQQPQTILNPMAAASEQRPPPPPQAVREETVAAQQGQQPTKAIGRFESKLVVGGSADTEAIPDVEIEQVAEERAED